MNGGDEASPMSVEGGLSFLWGSERTGFMHLYLYTFKPGDDTATLVNQVTSGDWVVEGIAGVDEAKGRVYVTGTYRGPLERHLCAAPIRGGEITVLTDSLGGGMHNVVMSLQGCSFVDVSSQLDSPTQAKLYDVVEVEGKPSARLRTEIYSAASSDLRLQALKPVLVPPVIQKIKSRDGQADLYVALYVPDSALHGPGPYPAITSVYGGPHVQRVAHSWGVTVDLRAQYLRSLGFLVIKCDNRGSFRRGLAFESQIHRCMGTVEVTDQEDAVHFAASKGLVDVQRGVGVYGWSYGGYMAALCLCLAPDTFRVAVSGAPVTSWDGYDTHYTERYMGTPQNNPGGYKRGSVLEHCAGLRAHARLMLVHGLIDENVHFRHTARLINALIAARKSYDFLLFPNERHAPRSLKDRIYMEERVSEYFVQHLMKEPLPIPSNL
eukprot:CAMPEP_0113940496 /NCGR_PEP_ID=MMETSP1339-20121228/6620_1 /TAXON_ID=94617 /ORGANISM="Fibrocapsa japonica" /LENGTH=435 /DNA_ID=CAMNT_0000944351 /DNA_START=1 /DNA_END=1308 /DNA_ORIENTATION=+ /assembly_acc=CAM_ASM_000762